MIRQRVGILLIVLVVGSLVVPTAAATDTRVDPAEVCDRLSPDRLTVTAVTHANAAPLSDGTALYAGTTLTVVLCQANDEPVATESGQGWALDASPGILSVQTRTAAYQVTLANADATVAFSELVVRKNPQAGVTVSVIRGPIVDSEFDEVDTVAFEGQQTADRYVATEAAYLKAVAAVRDNATALNETAEAVRQRGLDAVDPNDTLMALNETAETADVRANQTKLLLFNATYVGNDGSGALAATERTNQRADAVVDAALRTYIAALDERRAIHANDIQNTLLFALIPGFVVGALAGAVVPYRKGSEKADFMQQRAGIAYDRSVLKWPLLGALGAVVLGIGILVFTGAHRALLP